MNVMIIELKQIRQGIWVINFMNCYGTIVNNVVLKKLTWLKLIIINIFSILIKNNEKNEYFRINSQIWKFKIKKTFY